MLVLSANSFMGGPFVDGWGESRHRKPIGLLTTSTPTTTEPATAGG